MNTPIEHHPPVNVQVLMSALDALQPDVKDQRRAVFREAYPGIVKKLQSGVKESKIIELLAQQGILKSRATFAKWMEEMGRGQKERSAERQDPSAVREAFLSASR